MGIGNPGGSTAFVPTGTIQVLQFIVLTVGVVLSLYTARRIAHHRYQGAARRRATLVPMISVVLILTVLNVLLFLSPMSHRM